MFIIHLYKHFQFLRYHQPRLTKLFLAPVPVQVDPQLPPNIVFHTGIFLIMQSVQSTTNNSVNLKFRIYRLQDIPCWTSQN